MDLAVSRADGIDFFVHKAGEGGNYADPYFAEGIRRAVAAGLPLLGAYYVNYGGDEAVQAAHFVALLDAGAPGWRSMPFLLMADCERWTYGVATIPAPDIASIHRFCDSLALRAGVPRRRIVVYAPDWAYGDGALVGLRYALWSSNYAQSGASRPYRAMYAGDDGEGWARYSGGPTPMLWQYASDAVIGTQRPCDINAYRGTLDELLAELGFDEGSGAVAVKRWSTVVTGPTGNSIAALAERAPNADELWISSGMDGDHGPAGSSHHYGLTYNGSPTAALDVVGNAEGAGLSAESQRRMRDFAKWCYDTFPDLIVELIHTTPYPDDDGFYVLNGVRQPGGGPYGDPGNPSSTAGQHADHVHLAMSADQVAAAMARLDATEAPPSPEPPPSNGDAFLDDYDAEVMAYRVEGLVKLLPASQVPDGPAQGEALPVVSLLLDIQRQLVTLHAKVDGMAALLDIMAEAPAADPLAEHAVAAVRALGTALRQLDASQQ